MKKIIIIVCILLAITAITLAVLDNIYVSIEAVGHEYYDDQYNLIDKDCVEATNVIGRTKRIYFDNEDEQIEFILNVES